MATDVGVDAAALLILQPPDRCCVDAKLVRARNRSARDSTPRIENGGTFAVDSAEGRRDRHNIDVRPDAPQRFGVPYRLFRGRTYCA
jgi:hypothetical protein